MGFDLKKPFKDYVAADPLPKTGDATNFTVSFPHQIEGTPKTECKELRIAYTGTQAAMDERTELTD
jgi:hypothetical protein